ncbi:MAG: substrate-binding domain-containing protein, partial [Candidatus Pacebacteria bacterium]|nr:substrate-binding domain-containing protein [Candidatus Paceibacterota bacterium]
TVLLNYDIDDHTFPSVGSQNRRGVKSAMKYLADLGHRRVAHLAGREDEYVGIERLAGYREAVRELGLEDDPALVAFTNFNYDGGARATEELLARNIEFSAIMAANDYTAIGAMSALSAHGLRVPQDVSVVGYSGDETGLYYNPALTTVREPAEEILHEAVKLIVKKDPAAYSHAGQAPKIQLPTELIVRNSCIAKQ